MFSEQFFDLLLNFGDDWKVERIQVDIKKEEVEVYVNFIGQKAEDPDLKELCKIYDHAPLRRWRHLDTMQFKTFICCSVPRIINKEGNVKTIEIPWADDYERHTYMFERLAIDILTATKNQTQTAKLLRCGFNVINRIIHNSVKRGLKSRPKNYCFEHLSIDEKSFQKGHNYVTVLSEPISGIVIEVTENRDYESCHQALTSSIKEEDLEKVQTVCIDMWKPYIKASKELLPKAEIIHDKFHMVKYLNDAIDKVRRREVKHHKELKDMRYVLLKNPNNQTEKQRIKFESISNSNYEVSRAWRVRENFKDIFGCQSIEEAFTLVIQWINHAIFTNIKEINKVVIMFKNHLKGVINAMVNTFTNAMAERLNGKIQEIKFVGRGYRRFSNFRNAILFFHGGLNLYPLK